MESGARRSRSFAWLNATQFFGALNDNVFKLLLVYFLIATRGTQAAATAGVLGLVLLATPFLLFSAAAGVLADRASKRTIVVWAKVAEVVLMLLGVVAFGMRSVVAIGAVMFLMAAQSALFGPAKYGIVPELVGRERLSRANALIQAFTYLAIILGTVVAPLLSRITSRNYVVASLFCVAIAVAGTLTSLPIERTAAGGSVKKPSWLFVRDIWRTLYAIRADHYLFMAVLAAAYFSLLGSFMQFNLIPYGLQALGVDQEGGTYLFLLAAVGIGLGSICAGRLSGRNVELGVVPLGAIGLTVGSLALGSLPGRLVPACFFVFLLGLSAGLFIVPIQSWIQFRSPRGELGEVLAASGFLGWIGVILAAGMIHLLSNVLHFTARQGFLILGWMTLALTVVALRILPDFFVRFIFVLITRCVYRLRVVGAGNIPVEGPALLVCNHVSWVDSLLLSATQQRRIRFLAWRKVYEKRWLNPIMRLFGVIPISSDDTPKKIVTALREARAALDDGWLVCIFAEGAVTRTGNLLSFKSGFERIVQGTNYPIIPVYVGGAWGSIFSYYHGRPMTHWPVILPYPVTILFGKPLPPATTTADLRQAVLELACEYFNDKKPRRRPLGEQFIRSARANWFRRAVADTTGKRLNYGQTLTAAVALAAELEPRVAGQDKVGLLLPPSVAAVLANLAVALLGRAAVNLNYTASREGFASSVAQCGLRTVLTSRALLQKLEGFPVPEGAVYIEDLLSGLSPHAKRLAFLQALLVPPRWLARSRGFTADQVATVIFSSGSTAEPKGILLSHHNILSNIEGMRMVFHPTPEDCVCGVLPFFHSFGYTACLWFPILSGFSAVYHSHPLEGEKVAEAVRVNKASLLFATPTFLLAYIRRAKKEDFATLRMVIAGAEKLKPRIADAFQDRFGLRPMEGYGATELAPVTALNVPDRELGGLRQVGVKEGTVGHPIPGIVARIVDPDTRQPVPQGQAGLLLIKGPNVMLGYLNRPDLTHAAIQDGWYDTGDMAVMDPDGFIAITDRLSRFSKIAGEMVPHLAVEEALHRALKKTDQVLAVASAPDEKRGEKLVVLYTADAGTPEDLQRAVAESDLPNLWKPNASNMFRIDAVPILGSGKLDLKALKQKAKELTGPEARS